MNAATTKPETLSEIVDIENSLIPSLLAHEPSSKKSNPILIFIITMVLFFSSRIVSADVFGISILVGVILFHELGHFVMMKILKYNDVRMFFIPFIGAAVSGKTKNNSTLKSCIVSLMGPLPGIILSVGFYILFGLTHQYVFLKAFEVMLFLNLFNLLPIVPFDGGRFLETLFIDNLIIRSLYSIFSVMLLAVLAYLFEDVFFLLIAVFSLWAFIKNVRIWKLGIAYKKKGLRASTIQELSENKNTITEIASSLFKIKPKSFHPVVDVNAVYGFFEEITDILSFKSLRMILKFLLFLFYTIVFIVSVLFMVIYLLTGYREENTEKSVEGNTITVCQIYMFGQLNSEIPIDENGYYDGKGSGYRTFQTGNSLIESEFYFKTGYRTGTWIDYDETGTPIKKAEYRDGIILSESIFSEDTWKTLSASQFPFSRKVYEFIRRVSQPRKSLAPFFSE